MKRFYFPLFDANLSPDNELNSSPKAQNSGLKFAKTKRAHSRLDPSPLLHMGLRIKFSR